MNCLMLSNQIVFHNGQAGSRQGEKGFKHNLKEKFADQWLWMEDGVQKTFVHIAYSF